MKKISLLISLVLVAGTAVSCLEEQASLVPDQNDLVELSLVAGMPETKTMVGTDGAPMWVAGDRIGVTDAVSTNFPFVNDATENTSTTTFTGETAVADRIFAYYPYSTLGVDAKGAKVNIPYSQNAAVGTFDGQADVLVSQAVAMTAEGKVMDKLVFRRLTSVIKLVVKDPDNLLTGEKINDIKITAEKPLTGDALVDFNTSEFGELVSGAKNSVKTALPEDKAFVADGQKAIYFSVYPQQLTEGSKLTFRVITANHKLEKEVVLPKALDLASGIVNTLNLTVKDADLIPFIKVTRLWSKTFDDLQISNKYMTDNGHVGFSGDKIVTRNLEVLDMQGAKVGKLNVEGVVDSSNPDFAFNYITNDHENHLVACVSYDQQEKYAPEGMQCKFYIWTEGWDKAPALLYQKTDANMTKYISAAGNLPKEGILMIKAPGASQTEGNHHRDYIVDGKIQWAFFKAPYATNDGNWGQLVSAASGKLDGAFFTWDSVPGGQSIFVRQGWNGQDTALKSSAWYKYGNYTRGTIKAFMFNDRPMVIVVSSGWPCVYLTVMTGNPSDADHYLYQTEQIMNVPEPSCGVAYYTDKVTGNGYFAVTGITVKTTGENGFQLYEIANKK